MKIYIFLVAYVSGRSCKSCNWPLCIEHRDGSCSDNRYGCSSFNGLGSVRLQY